MVQGMTEMADAKNNGLHKAEPRTPENTTPTSLRQWCEEGAKARDPTLIDWFSSAASDACRGTR